MTPNLDTEEVRKRARQYLSKFDRKIPTSGAINKRVYWTDKDVAEFALKERQLEREEIVKRLRTEAEKYDPASDPYELGVHTGLTRMADELSRVGSEGKG
jgi:hypothetical protein